MGRGAAAVVVAAALAAAATTAAAKPPLPTQPQGSGSERTSGAGTIAGAAFVARAALVEADSISGDVSVYLLGRPSGCRVISYADAPFVWVIVHTEGSPLVVGKPSLSNGRDQVQVNFTLKDHYVAVQPGVQLVLTRVDPSKGGTWHGRLSVRKTTYKGKVYAFTGTFAARWCGTS